MKKMVFCIIPIIMIIMGCASSGTVVAETNGSSLGIDLDVAIKEAATQMEANLPGGTKVALVSMASSSTQFSEYVISRLEAVIVSGKRLVVVDRANLDKVRDEQGFQLSGEVDDDSAKAIGKLAGAGAIVTGGFTNLGDVYSLTLKAINIETATVAVSYPADVTKSTRIETLLASGGGAASRNTPSGGATTATGVKTSVVPVVTPQPIPQPQLQISENDLVGVWKGSYHAGQGETALVLTIYNEGGKYMAIFDFYNLPGKSNSGEGKYYMDVSYNRTREKFYLKGVTWIERPSNYNFADLEGTITGDVFNGFLSGSSNTFRVVRDKTGAN
ncbi:hypothetical protein FACS189468_8140 [Spirochaetia bacterium]|nr:hypothetical protein FACS189468_8140 [Spirochaetia bacterium]